MNAPNLEDILNRGRPPHKSWFERLVEKLQRLKLALQILAGKGSYVVIYDREIGADEIEEYYGYFDSPAEASAMFSDAFGGDPAIMEGRTKLCLVMEDWN